LQNRKKNRTFAARTRGSRKGKRGRKKVKKLLAELKKDSHLCHPEQGKQNPEGARPEGKQKRFEDSISAEQDKKSHRCDSGALKFFKIDNHVA
jgi:hypothetical protein